VREQQAIEGTVEVTAEQKLPGVFRITARVVNDVQMDPSLIKERDAALMRALVSTHIVLTLADGDFASQTDPPPGLEPIVSECSNIGCWPVLVGEENDRRTMLASPIILYDYPKLAPQSPGDLFDGTEIDEILTLRIMTLTDDEKRQVAAVDHRAADMLARTENLAREQLMNLHGTVRTLQPAVCEEQHG